jgi:hypothetical protein
MMKKKKNMLSVILVSCLFFMASSLFAEDASNDFYGNLMFGYRYVDTNGQYEKYREDINLDEGARLFNFSLHYIPNGEVKKLFDRLDINLYNFGGDPFETFGLSFNKSGKYQFKFNRRKATYFYQDIRMEGGHLFDLHSFNFDRVMDSSYLRVWLSKNVNVYFNFDRYTKKGESVTTYDINRIEFEYDKPIEEDSKEFTAGINVHLKGLSFVLEEKIQDYENTNSLFLPGYADGGAGARYPSSLDYFYLDQPYDLKSNTHTVKATARPFNNMLISGAARLSSLDMDLDYSESAAGVNYLNRSFSYSHSGKGEFERKLGLYDLEITFLLANKLAFIAAIRKNTLEQHGTFMGESSDFSFDTLGVEGGLQYQFSPKFGLTMGYRFEERELENLETVYYEEETTRKGFFGTLNLQPNRTINLTADYQHGSFDEPYTLISASSFNRLRFTAKIKMNQLGLSGSYLWKKTENDVYDEGWESTDNRLNLRAGYYSEKVKLSAGYSWIVIEHSATRDIAYPPGWLGPGSFPWTIDYEGKSNLFNASLAFNPSEQWTIGAYGNIYDNTGFWEISRTTLKGYVEYKFESGFVTQLGYRYVDFKEENIDENDYTANILELSFGYRWK